MAKQVKLPQISEGADTANVAEILISKGDNIEEGQSIITVETEKAAVDVPAPESGKVKEIKVKEGDEIKVGDVILVMEAGKEKPEEKKKEKVAEKEEKKEKKKEKEEKEERKQAKERKEEKPSYAEARDDRHMEKDEEAEEEREEVPASPAVRRLARELGVEISRVKGSGPVGLITEEDVKSYIKEQERKTTKQPELPDFSKWGKIERQPLTNIRAAIARNTADSWRTIPHVTQFDKADITGIEKYREENSKKVKEAGVKLTLTAVLIKIAANALQRFPKFNGSIDMENEEMILKKYCNIGVAVDTEKGLLVPVLRDVDTKSVADIAVEITELAEKARNQELRPEDMQGGSFVISNLGGIGGTNFTPIVYHPQVAVLGVSRTETFPVFMDGNFEPREILPLALSYDHRLIDGADGARFLRWICQSIEEPYKALLGV